MDELAFIAWLQRTEPQAPGVCVPLGDDACVLGALQGAVVVCTDSVAEGVHFESGTSGRAIGHKAAARNLSDLAAMGAQPTGMLLSLILPRESPTSLAQDIVDGVRAACAGLSCPLIGGDTTTHTGGIVVNVSMLGTLVGAAAVVRSGARVGDVLCVTGALGGSRHGRHLQIAPRLAEAAALVRLGPPSAMIDISDGLLLDLERIADASGCGYQLDASTVPIHADVSAAGDRIHSACTDGEDFELLFTMPESMFGRTLEAWPLATPITRIGVITATDRCVLRDGVPWNPDRRGYVHG